MGVTDGSGAAGCAAAASGAVAVVAAAAASTANACAREAGCDVVVGIIQGDAEGST